MTNQVGRWDEKIVQMGCLMPYTDYHSIGELVRTIYR